MPTTLKDLVRVYEQVEIELLELVAQAVSREAYGTAGKYKASLEQLQQLMQTATTKLGAMQRHITPHMLEAIEAEFAQAVAEAYRQAGAPVPVVVDVNAANAIATATTEKVVSQHTQILRAVADMYQQTVQAALTTAMFSGESNTGAVQRALNTFADRGITAFRDVNGRRWGIDTYTDMALRTGRMRALMEGHMQGWRGAGVELVRVSTHAASHPWCYPFQGELLALDGQAGTRVMKSPITGKNEVVTVKATMQEAIEAGYKHINCRHSEAPYVPGAEVTVPDKPSEEENEQEYKALQRQRQIERHIRHWKKRQAVALTPQEKQLAARKVKAWQRAQRDHIKANKFLVRRYEREQVRLGKAGTLPVRKPRTTPKPTPTRTVSKLDAVPKIEHVPDFKTVARAVNPLRNETVPPTRVPKSIRDALPAGGDVAPYSVNCTRVQAAYEARMRGLDVTAGPWPHIAPDGSVGDGFDALKVSFKQKDGGAPGYVSVPTPKSGRRGKRLDTQLVKYMEQQYPDGARGYAQAVVGGSYGGTGYGHAFNWVKVNGKIEFVNPQNPDFPYMDMDAIKPGSLKIARVDEHELAEGIMDVISGEVQ